MKKARFLTRDWRMVEPKKTGQPKAGGRDGSFLKWGVPRWFKMENPNLKWMIWRYPHFEKPPYVFIETWPGEASYRKSRFLLQKMAFLQQFPEINRKGIGSGHLRFGSQHIS